MADAEAVQAKGIAMLKPCAKGNYRFLPGIAPFSSGAVADPGYQVVHATLRRPLPWRKGFDVIDAHLSAERRPRQALCAIELRIPEPLTGEGFDSFNAGYRALLDDWKILLLKDCGTPTAGGGGWWNQQWVVIWDFR